MTGEVSATTQAVLLLTAPLLAGRRDAPVATRPLTVVEYNRFARRLSDCGCEPAELLGGEAGAILERCAVDLDLQRLQRLLGRGFLLAQALDRWRGRAIWAIGRADAGYPQRMREALKGQAPPILYGFGEAASLDQGGLAVVGSRKVDAGLVAYAGAVGRLAAAAERILISGGARGIDRAAMAGALQAGGKAVAVLADSLERAVMRRENRESLMDGKLILVCPYDPAAIFTVGHAMGRNKLIYALADAALVVQSDHGTGGTWNGAVDHLDRSRRIPVYVRPAGRDEKGLQGLRERGAQLWAEPATPQALQAILDETTPSEGGLYRQEGLFPDLSEERGRFEAPPSPEAEPPPRDRLFARVRVLLAGACAVAPRREDDMTSIFPVSKTQMKAWLKHLVSEGTLEKRRHPVRYLAGAQGDAMLFPVSDRELGSALLAGIRVLLARECEAGPKSATDIAAALHISPRQAADWLNLLVSEGVLEKQQRPVRYRAATGLSLSAP